MAEDEERIIRNKIEEIVNHDQEVKNNPELMDILELPMAGGMQASQCK